MDSVVARKILPAVIFRGPRTEVRTECSQEDRGRICRASQAKDPPHPKKSDNLRNFQEWKLCWWAASGGWAVPLAAPAAPVARVKAISDVMSLWASPPSAHPLLGASASPWCGRAVRRRQRPPLWCGGNQPTPHLGPGQDAALSKLCFTCHGPSTLAPSSVAFPGSALPILPCWGECLQRCRREVWQKGR